jgi:hypothetical protein
MATGLDIVRRVYQRLRKPSQGALPHKQVLAAVQETIARKKLDLALSSQNSLGVMSDWFTPTSPDFDISDVGISGVMLPIRVETRAADSTWETGEDVPIVNYEALNTSEVGAVSFYGDPLRLAFRDTTDYITLQQYRLVYEPDFYGTTSLGGNIGLPGYFAGMVAAEAAWKLLLEVEDTSPEWMAFASMQEKRLLAEITDYRDVWDTYVKQFKGRAQVPKRTFWQNRRATVKTRYFRG